MTRKGREFIGKLNNKDFEKTKMINGKKHKFVDYSWNKTHLEKMIGYTPGLKKSIIIIDERTNHHVLYQET